MRYLLSMAKPLYIAGTIIRTIHRFAYRAPRSFPGVRLTTRREIFVIHP